MERDGTPAFARLFANLLKARFPYLYVTTWEEERVLAVIRSLAQDPAIIKTPRSVFVWGLTTGFAQDASPSKEETKAPLKALEFVEKYEQPAIFVFKDFHIFFGIPGHPADPLVVRKIRDVATVLKQSAKPKSVVFVSPQLVLPEDLQKDITLVDFCLPTFEEIHSLLKQMIAVNRDAGRIVMDLPEDASERLAKAALGLTLQEAENAFAHAMVEDGRLDIQDVEVILQEKSQIIKKTGILELVESDLHIDDVGGLENLKRWLKKRDKSWLESAKRYQLPSPKGVLITGVPGCGKSLIVKAISAMWRVPLLRLDVGKIFSGILGSSEQNMRQAIQTAEAIAPCVLWIDEIEKGFSGTTFAGDSGTSSRIFGTFLTWMQEKSKPVFVAATANNISALPPELLRKGRFDEIFFVDLPTLAERTEIFRIHLNKRLKDPNVIGEFRMTNEVFEQLARRTEGYSGAEIEQAVVSALFDAFAEDRSICPEDFYRAIANTVPLAVTSAEQIRALRQWANQRAVAATAQADRADYASQGDDSAADVQAVRGGRTVDF